MNEDDLSIPSRHPSWMLILLAVGAALSYVALLLLTYQVSGLLALAPIAALGWYYGRRAGLLGGMLSLVLCITLWKFMSFEGWHTFSAQEWFDSTLVIWVGFGSGWISALMDQAQHNANELLREQAVLRAQIVERTRAESALRTREAQVQLQAARSAVLAEVGHAFAAAELNYESVLNLAAEQVADLLGDACIIRLVSNDGQRLELVALHYADAETEAWLRMLLSSMPQTVHEGLSGQVMLSGQPLLIAEMPAEEFHAATGPGCAAYHDRFRFHSVLIVPLRVQNHVIGVLGMYREVASQPYTPGDQQFLQDLADRAALAIGNARLHAAVQRQLVERSRAEEQRLSLERKLLEAQKLESLGVLAGGVAHDFNNLLAIIMGNLNLAQLDLPPDSPVQESIQAIRLAGQRAIELTRQMLAYSGKGHFVIQLTDLNAIIREMVSLMRPSIAATICINYLPTPYLPAIEADATQLRQMVMNLLLNAAESIREQPGVITISTGVREIDTAYLSATYLAPDLPAGEYVYMEIADTGCGMDAATQKRIFEPFFTTKFTGRGLGLAAVLGIVRGHKGALMVKSAPGSGTTFTILLPHAESPAQPLKLRQIRTDVSPEPGDQADAVGDLLSLSVNVLQLPGRVINRSVPIDLGLPQIAGC